MPERKRPASSRTANLPAVSSIKELLGFLLANFGEAEGGFFWVTPEELCDIVEHYADILQVQWSEDSCSISEDMAYVTIFNKGQVGENIALTGLFPFLNEQEARRYCNNDRQFPTHLIGQLEGLFGIQGRFAVNFMGEEFSNYIHEELYHKEKEIEALDLWPRIFQRYRDLGISLG